MAIRANPFPVARLPTAAPLPAEVPAATAIAKAWANYRRSWSSVVRGDCKPGRKYHKHTQNLIGLSCIANFAYSFAILIVFLKPFPSTRLWRVALGSYLSVAPVALAILFAGCIGLRELPTWAYWSTGLFASSQLWASMIFLVLELRSGPDGRVGLVGGLVAVSFLHVSIWIERLLPYARSPSLRAYAPICNAGCVALPPQPAQPGEGPLSRLYGMVPKQAQAPKSVGGAPSALPKYRESMLPRVTVPSEADFWMSLSSISTVVAILTTFSLAHVIFQVYEFARARQEHQSCDWSCVFNVTYIWLHVPWVMFVCIGIKRRLAFQQRVLYSLTVAEALLLYYLIAVALWLLGIYTTIRTYGWAGPDDFLTSVWPVANMICQPFAFVFIWDFARRALARQPSAQSRRDPNLIIRGEIILLGTPCFFAVGENRVAGIPIHKIGGV